MCNKIDYIDEFDYNFLRYYLEHKILPYIFYSAKNELIKQLKMNGNSGLFAMLELSAKNITGIINADVIPYSPDEFGINCYVISKDKYFIVINMPEPLKPSECKRIYLLYNDEFRKMLYVTVELNNQQNSYSIHSADKNGTEFNHGKCPKNITSEQKKIIRIFEDFI